MKHPCVLSWILALLLTTTGHSAPVAAADSPEYSEYEVKAGFLYNIAKFVEWPEGSGPAQGPITLCILGADPFGRILDGIEGKTVRGKPLEIRRCSSVRELKECRIVFISASEKERVSKVVDALRESSVLTVGDTDGYIREGVIMNFYMEGKRVRFEIDPERARRAKLGISSQLLKLARIASGRQ